MKKSKKILTLLLAIALCLGVAAVGVNAYTRYRDKKESAARLADPNFLAIIPQPNGRVEMGGERVPLPAAIGVNPGEFSPDFFDVYAQRAGVELSEDAPAFITAALDEALPSEGYLLRVTGEQISIEAADERGLCWALTTLAALTQDGSVPQCDITDAPHFAYRGFMMDSARHFFPVETIKTLIELTSMVKMNVFHWHLTDDQGWRVESKLFPALHEQNASEYYTQEEILDVIEFARLRGVEVIPEIDLPGHATAIMAAYPALSCSERPVEVADIPGIRSVILCAGKEAVFDLLFPLLEEMAELFSSRYIHLGGDEAPKEEWDKCPHCRQRMEEEGIGNLEDLQGWFTARLAAHMRDLGKQCICWNESLLSERLPGEVPDLIIQHWAEVQKIGQTRQFWEQGGGVIFSDEFGTYFDLPHGAVSLKKAYSYGPRTPGFKGKDAQGDPLPALGLEACQWTEFIDASDDTLALLTFPRVYATAEAAWTRPELKNYRSFRGRLDIWLNKYPGMGFTPPEKADPGLIEGYRGTVVFLRKLSKALDKENPNNAGMGAKMDWRYVLRWLGNYFIY